MNLADFSAISNGTYNLGSIRLEGEGEQASLVKINNHRWLSNNVPDDPAANARVRQALSDAIRQEAGIPRDVLERLVGDLTSDEHINQPLDRRDVRSVLQQIGESRLHDQGIHAKFTGRPELNTAVAMTALACLPQQKGDQPEISKMIVSAAVRAFEKGDLKLDKDFSAEARVQVFHRMFRNLEPTDMPTHAELRAMTPEDFFAKCSGICTRMRGRLNDHTADVIFPEHSLFIKYHADKDWESIEMERAQMTMANQFEIGIFSPGDLATLKNDVREFSLKNLPSMKVAMESNVGGVLSNFAKMSAGEANETAEKRLDTDVVTGRLKGEFRFSLNNDKEFRTLMPGNKALDTNRLWVKMTIDDVAKTRHQAAAVKLLLSQEPLQPFRAFTYMLGLTEYDEHTGFNYYLNENEDGSLQLEIKKDFTEFGKRNISASFTWRIETNGTATMEDFNVKLPR